MENWKSINGTNGKYHISSIGIVKSNKRILKPHITEQNRLSIRLQYGNKSKTKRIDRLVAEHFVDNPYGYDHILHIDGNPTNCEYTNLMWVKKPILIQHLNGDIQDTEFEHWRIIPNTNGLYKISDNGRVFSLKSNKILNLHPQKTGYHTFSISVNNKVRLGTVHRLVAELFIPNPDNLPQVDHIDGNSQNNHISNLRWVTAKENCNNPNTKCKLMGRGLFPNQSVQQIKDGVVIDTFPSINKVRAKGFIPSAVSRCCHGFVKSHRGYQWKFSDIDSNL